jgi:hypothetical protein
MAPGPRLRTALPHPRPRRTRRPPSPAAAAFWAALLAGAAAVTLPRAVQATGADAELLALHRAFLVQDALCHAWNGQRVSEEIGEPAHDRWWECIDAAEMIPARTFVGLRAKADIALKGLELVGDSDSAAEDLARAVLGEIAAWGAAA